MLCKVLSALNSPGLQLELRVLSNMQDGAIDSVHSMQCPSSFTFLSIFVHNEFSVHDTLFVPRVTSLMSVTGLNMWRELVKERMKIKVRKGKESHKYE